MMNRFDDSNLCAVGPELSKEIGIVGRKVCALSRKPWWLSTLLLDNMGVAFQLLLSAFCSDHRTFVGLVYVHLHSGVLLWGGETVTAWPCFRFWFADTLCLCRPIPI